MTMSARECPGKLSSKLDLEQLSGQAIPVNSAEIQWDESPNDNPTTNYTVPGRKCPNCLAKGQTVWVIKGKCCPQCGTVVN
ncbi:hypothetical protein BDY21DRAFT_336688 [Lineolata rhizophorae]|uniref:Uncharacterized protein n=1 Tax=Lineolata rhizophorae TaxID=578093 RepID=A0A6A6P7K3_9PEZI|nr:hypothetical protein BDY21DRAFT_336688 [Lineolata rhizophorae]